MNSPIPLPTAGFKCIQIHTYGPLAGLRCHNYSNLTGDYCIECSHYRRYAQMTKEDKKTQCKNIFTTGPLKGQRCVAKASENGYCDRCLLDVTEYRQYIRAHYFDNKSESESESESEETELSLKEVSL